MNIDHLTAIAVLSVIQARYRDKAPPDKDVLVNWLKEEGSEATASFIQALPSSTYRQVLQSIRRVKVSARGNR